MERRCQSRARHIREMSGNFSAPEPVGIRGEGENVIEKAGRD